MSLLDANTTSELSHGTAAWRSFLAKVAATLGTRGVLLIVSFVSSVITSRYLGPEGRGVYAVLTLLSATGVQLGNFGLHAANTFYLGQDRSLRGQIVANSVWVSAALGLVFVTTLLVLQPLLWTPAGQPLWIYYAAVAVIPFSLFYLLALNIWLGLGKIVSFNAMEVFVNLAGLLAVALCLVVFQWGVGSLILYSTLFNAIVASWLFTKLRDRETSGFDLSLFSRMFQYGLKAYIAAIFAFLVLRFDLLIVSRMVGTRAAGIYSTAVQIADVLYLLPVSIGLVLFPELSGMKSGAWNFTRRTAGFTACILGICCVIVWLVAPLFIELAYGREFGESANALKWLLPGIWTLGVNAVFMNYFAGTGMPRITVISPAIAFCVNIGLNLLLIPRMGVSGASLASTVSYSIMLACSGMYLTLYEKRHK